MKLAQFFLVTSIIFVPLAGFSATESPARVEAPLNGSGIKKTTVYDDAYLYVQLAEVSAGTAAQVKETFNANGKSKGVVLDLRFGAGTNATAAAEVADLFIKGRETLLQIGERKVGASPGNDAIALPVAVLVNSRTTGSAEVLAAILKENKVGLTFGTPTPGTNSFGEEILIKNRPLNAVRPDILAEVAAEEEMMYLGDPYKEITTVTNATEVSVLPPVRRRINEAELIRNRNLEELEATAGERPEPRAIRDPVLARGLDFLKAVNLLQVKRG